MDNPFFDANDQSGLQMGRNLPHWHQSGKYVFVTFRLNDSLPQTVLERYALEKEEWMQKHPKPWDDSVKKDYYQRFSNKIDKWLDVGIGSCMLSGEKNRVVVEEALKYYDGVRYDLKAYVVMPNHVHVLFQLKESFLLSDIVRKWKSYTAKLINQNEKREGRVWQSESFDHILRNEMQFYHIVKYIYDNNHSLAFVKNAEWLAM